MKTKILAKLRDEKGYVSGQALCNEFGVSRTAIWKAINRLKQEGYEIEAVQNKGYRLVNVPEILSQKELLSIRKTQWLGNEIIYYDEVDSTNNAAKRLAEEGYGHGTIVVSDAQTGGRGRRGRSWSSPAGVGIWMTYILRPEQLLPANASMITLVMGLAVAKGLEEATDTHVSIKWPNDIVMNGKKVCGTLTEMSAQMDYINYLVVGSGINVFNKEFPQELSEKATSLYIETKKEFHRAEIIETIAEKFEEYYDIFMQTEDMSRLKNEYNDMLVNRGGQVRVEGRESFDGNARGINERGELIVDTWEARRLVSSGEVSVRGVYGYV